MSLYTFKLKNLNGCYVGIKTASLKEACTMYKHVVSVIGEANNDAVEKVEKFKSEVKWNGINKT